MKLFTAMPVAALAVCVAGCSTVQSLWSSGPTEQKRVRAGVTEFACDAKKKLQVSFDSGGKFAWVIFPEREFRLDAVSAGTFSNGRATLTTSAEGTQLEEGSSVTFANCKRAAGA